MILNGRTIIFSPSLLLVSLGVFVTAEVRTYREAAEALMHPIEMFDKEARKRLERTKNDFSDNAVINSSTSNNGDEEDQESSPIRGAIRKKGQGRATQDKENCSLS